MIYRKVSKKHPERVKAIFIRELESKPIDSERWAKFQEPLRIGVCHKFATAEQLTDLAAPIIAKLGTAQLV